MKRDPDKIGRYQVLERVGRGGMGVLYRGIDPVLDREVAIKLMLADFSEDSEQMRPRFYREAKAAAKLQHRNIVTVFEFAEENGTPYIVMEFLRGMSLAARMAAAPPLTLTDKLDVVAQLCAGLHYAHEQGVVHRDVKPANIFLLTDSSVKLLDFGIAKLLTSTLTRQGDMLGSASYMSPEQVAGREDIDRRADIFSTGVVLYELLAGRKPFEAESPTATIMKILHEEPPPIDLVVPSLPAQIVTAVRRALAKDPANRFSTAGEFGRELQWIRKALQASGEGAAVFEETRFASTAVLRGLHQEIEKGHTPTPRPAAPAPTPAPAPELAVAPAGRKWLVPAGIAAVIVVGGIIAATMVRTGTTGTADPKPATAAVAPSVPSAPSNAAAPSSASNGGAPSSPSNTAAEPAPALPTKTSGPARTEIAARPLQIDSDPPGAAIIIDGRDTHETTPAVVTVSDGPHRLTLSKRGFQTVDLSLADADVRRGSASYQLKAAEAAVSLAALPAGPPSGATISVSFTSVYPFEVFDGRRSISSKSESHELKVAGGKTLRLVAPEFLLDRSVRIEGTPGKRFEQRAPDLGKLTVRSKFETCQVRIGDRELGYPPIVALPVAAGAYVIDLICPNGQNQRGSATVQAGQTYTAIVP